MARPERLLFVCSKLDSTSRVSNRENFSSDYKMPVYGILRYEWVPNTIKNFEDGDDRLRFWLFQLISHIGSCAELKELCRSSGPFEAIFKP